MEIKIRNINPTTVQRINELAKKKNISRNEYLRHMLETFTALEEFKTFQEQYKNLIDNYSMVVEKNTAVLSEIVEILESE